MRFAIPSALSAALQTAGGARGYSAIALGTLVLLVPQLLAQPMGSGGPFELRASYIHQFETELENGGEFAMSRLGANFGWNHTADRRTQYGISFGYEVDQYDFSGDGPVFGSDPWGDIENISVGLSYTRLLENGWRIFVSPTVGSSGESSIDSDSLTYSLIAGGTTRLSDTLSLGVGFVALSGLEDTKAFPFLTVRWKFADRWTLQNPFRPGPAGPAGLEVAYAGEGWSTAVGFAYRSWRFRIEGDGPTLDGIAEYSGVPLFGRYTVTLGESLSLDLYGGFLVGADLEIEDSDGRSLGLKEDIDAAPFAAISISGAF